MKAVSGAAAASTHHSLSAGMLLRGGCRQYMWKAMSHSSHMSCLSGSCLPPHRWQAHTRQVLLSSSLQCLQEGPLFPGHRRWAQLWRSRPGREGTGAPAPRGRPGRAGPELTSHWVFNHGVPLARAVDLEHFIHEDDPTIIERIIPVRGKLLEHPSWLTG